MRSRLLLLLTALLLFSPAVNAVYLVEPLIIGGTNENNPPSYIVHLEVRGLTEVGQSTARLCGGSYVGDDRILTAAHCLEDEEASGSSDGFIFQSVKVSFDIPDGDLSNLDQAVTITATEYAEFPGYEFPDRDYAVIFLPEPAPASAVEIQLATELNTELWIESNIEVKTLGWGVTEAGVDDSTSDILQTVSLNLDNENTCGPDNICKLYEQSDYVVLAGATNEGFDACQGDSGGPLVRVENGISYLVGVTSFGIGCAEDGNSGGYAKVSAAKDWIRTIEVSSSPPKSLTEIATSQRELTGTGALHPLVILLLLPLAVPARLRWFQQTSNPRF